MLIVTAFLGQAFEAQLGQRNVPDRQFNAAIFTNGLSFIWIFLTKANSSAAMRQFAVSDQRFFFSWLWP